MTPGNPHHQPLGYPPEYPDGLWKPLLLDWFSALRASRMVRHLLRKGVSDEYAGLDTVDHNGAGMRCSRLAVCKEDKHGYMVHWPTAVVQRNTTSWSHRPRLDTDGQTDRQTDRHIQHSATFIIYIANSPATFLLPCYTNIVIGFLPSALISSQSIYLIVFLAFWQLFPLNEHGMARYGTINCRKKRLKTH